MFYPQDVIEDVRTGIDIVDVVSSYVSLAPMGNYHFGLCPFHSEKSPSFSVTQSKQMYHCFGCGASGNVFTFLMQIERLDFRESVIEVAKRINYKLPTTGEDNGERYRTKTQLYDIHKLVARYYYEILNSDEGKYVREYLQQREITQNMINKFGLGFSGNKRDNVYKFLLDSGYDIDIILQSGLVIQSKSGTYFDRFSKRLMFPIFDASGRIIGFGGRILTEDKNEAKYLNSPASPIFDKSRNLYGINFAKLSKKKYIVLVEGYMDVISLVQHGFDNAVASLGTAFNNNHVNSIRKYTTDVVILFDSDEAGIAATKKTIPLLVENGLKVSVVQVTMAKDPDEFLKTKGTDEFQKLLDDSEYYIDFLLRQAKAKYDINNVSEKVEFIAEATKILAKLNNEVEKDAYVRSIAKLTDISPEAISSDVNKINNNRKDPILTKKSFANPVTEKKAVVDAKKSLLTIILKDKNICKKVSEVLSPNELDNILYEQLYKLIIDLNKKSKKICEADMINFFETVEEQKNISNIFNTSIEFDDMSKIEKIINDLVKTIKLDYINILASKVTDIEELQNIVNSRKTLDKLYINITTG